MTINTIRTVLLGYGFSGKTFFAPFLDVSEGYLLKGAWERSKKKIQNDYDYTESYPSLEAVLADDQVDLVVVNTPIDTHFEYAKKVLEAGKHAIVEKAFTNTAEEAKELHLLAKSRGVYLFVFQNRRYDSDFKTTQKVLEMDKLGELVEATISYDFFVPNVRGDVHTEHPKSGGEYNNRGSHITDQAVKLFGIPDAVLADFTALRKDSPVEDYFLATLIYPDKRVKLRATDISLEHEYGYVFHGRNGSYLQDRTDIQEDRLIAGAIPSREDWVNHKDHKDGKLSYLEDGDKITEFIKSEEGNYFEYFDAVYQTIINNAPSPVSGWDGYRTMTVMDAVRRSAEEGKIIHISYEDIEK
ncbi:Gfo/Idh/MocA family oxidoreductase [Neptunitalea lumnitzerae]|uniref:Gfo/Idh/MocA family oxidoreductase n=1 Tax=Neptunitalea lumnitzerae TaxID=2965509 RepID=UPI00249379B4|nr:Gfo/Idh/MocA family oxidoreductase [Neptunitalea sp. Y10]